MLVTCGAGDKAFGPTRRCIVAAVTVPTAWVVLVCLGMWFSFRGTLHIIEAKRQKAVVVWNHHSWIDVLVLVYAFSPCVFVAKDFIRDVPLLGCVSRAFEPIWVSNKGGQGLAKIIQERVLDDDFPLVLIAPEGVTSKGSHLLKFRRGAFVSGQPVLPVLFSFQFQNVNPAWTLTSKAFHLLRLLTQFYNSVEITIRPVYEPSCEERDSAQLYSDRVRQSMASLLDVPMGDAGYAECKALMDAGIYVPFHGYGVCGNMPLPPNPDCAAVGSALSPAVIAATILEPDQTIYEGTYGFSVEHYQELQQLFERYDVDRSDSISRGELDQLMLNTCYAFCKKGMPHVPIKEVDRRLAEVPNDIQFSFDNWLQWAAEAFPEMSQFSRRVVASEF